MWEYSGHSLEALPRRKKVCIECVPYAISKLWAVPRFHDFLGNCMMVKGDHHLLQGYLAACPKPPVDIFHKSYITLSKPIHFQQEMK